MARTRGRSKASRVYWREQGGERRAYGDFRDFADVGGGREALIPERGKRATTDPDVAERLATERVEELEQSRRAKTILKIQRSRTLHDFAAHHLEQKALAGEAGARHLAAVERRLRVAIEFLGADRPLDSIQVRDVKAFMNHLARQPNRRGGKLSGGARLHYLNAISNLFERAQEEEAVRPGFNPARFANKPKPRREEARWLEPHEAALLLESARVNKPPKPNPRRKGKMRRATPGLDAILATFLLTGGRKSEVLGLDVEDVSFDRRTVTIRPNKHRRLKTSTSHRVVPLWPQLYDVLQAHVFDREEPLSGLLFPGRNGKMVGDLDKVLDTIAERAGWKTGEIRSKIFRHSYCAARLQTLDRGAAISPFTVAREMGHGGTRLVEKVYGHLGTVRVRSEVVEYRVEDHAERLGKRLEAVRGGE